MSALVSRAYLIPFTSLREDDDARDALLGALAQTVTELAEVWCGRKFEQEERTEYFDAYTQWAEDPYPQFLWVASFPIDVDSSLVLQYSRDRTWDAAAAMTSPKDYTVDAERGLIRVFGNTATAAIFPSGSSVPLIEEAAQGFRLVYTGGYAKKGADADSPWAYLSLVPEGLKTAAAMWTTHLFETSGSRGVGLETLSGNKPDARKALGIQAGEPPLEVKSILENFRRQRPRFV